jgi:CHAT domain
VAALNDQDMQVVYRTAIAPKASASRRSLSQKQTARVNVEVGADEDAVLLLEQDGVYSWQFPRQQPARKRALGGPRRLSFDIEIQPNLTPAKSRSLKGFVKKLLPKKVTATVFKFVVKVVAGAAVGFFERNVSTGLVLVNSADPAKWQPLAGADLKPPHGRASKVLVLIHGTFSSTRGSYAGLAATAEGGAFLEAALKKYDAILGFDHVTLSKDPAENARDLVAELKKLGLKGRPQIDTIAYSRGGLVYRSLVEHVLPGEDWTADINRAVFIGCTNGGTRLAEPDNWRTFVDLYTNLVAASGRVLAVVPGVGGTASIVVDGAVQGIGSFVKAIASGVVSDSGVPGIAAMEPDGKFITELNKKQKGQPTISATKYYAVVSNFEAKLGDGGVTGLPGQLLKMLEDGLVDQLMRVDNDLVVDDAAMVAMDPGTKSPIDGKLDFGANGQVYHLNYFAQPRVAESIAGWLAVGGRRALASGSPPAGPAPARGTRRAVRKPAARARKEPARKMARPSARNGGGGGYGGGGYGGGARRGRGARAIPAEPSPERYASANGDNGAPPPPPAPPRRRKAPVKTKHQILAQMDPHMVQAQVGPITVSISQDKVAAAAGKITDRKTIGLAQRKKISVHLIPRRNIAVQGRSVVELMPPSPGETSTVTFRVRGTRVGPAEAWVEVRQQATPLLTLKLSPKIVKRLPARKARSLSVRGEPREATPVPPRVNFLRVEEDLDGDETTYVYDLQCESLQILGRERSEPIRDTDTYVEQRYKEIEDRWVTKRGDVDAFTRELRSIGGRLFDELIPPKMQKLLWDNRGRIDNIMLLSMEPFVPWELVHLKQPGSRTLPDETIFLGQMGLVRWLWDGNWYPPEVKYRPGKVLTVCPDYPLPRLQLPQTALEAAFLEEELAAVAIEPESNAVAKLLEKPGSFDVMHFAGHGEASAGNIGNARILLRGRLEPDENGQEQYIPDYLNSTTVRETAALAARDGNRPLVVFNACQAGRSGRELSGIGGFADAFVGGGAGIFVSTLWSVGDYPARTFTETLYKELLRGRTLGTATKTARRISREAGDATWLAYVVYGDPGAKLVRAGS